MSVVAAIAHPPHELILASAGSGKTYQLASRYMRIVARGASPAAILATTFTRTAAAEIRDRVLLRLADAADDAPKRAELAALLARPDMTPDDVRTMLLELVRDVHRLEIGTLDAFFASLVQAFALELGLPADCQIIEETEAAGLRAEAIRRTFGDGDVEELTELLRQLTQGGSERSVVRPVDKAVSDLYALYRQAEPSAWSWLAVPPGRLNEPALADALAGLAAIAPPGHGRQRAAWDADLRQAQQGDWEQFLANGLAGVIAEGRGTYYRAAIADHVQDAYRPLVRHAVSVVAQRIRSRTEASHRLLQRFDVHYRHLKLERRLLSFDDLAALAERVAGERLGRRRAAALDHVLLDEFQDTSVAQWRALEPLLRSIVQRREGSFFCVGDLKQSIFGWRDAAPEILEQLPELLFAHDPSQLDETSLARTWRSAPPIIDAVNRVFTSLAGNEALREERAAAERWARTFEPHATYQTELPGYVELRTLAGDDRGRADAAARLAAALHRLAPARRIGILTRTRRTASAILYRLWQEQVAASGLGGGSLTEAPAVNAILDLLTLADHPEDTAAAFHVQRSPLGAALGVPEELATARGRAARHGLSLRIRRDLLEHGYAATIAGWLPRVAGASDERELQRLVQLVELATAFDQRGGGRCGDLVTLVESKDVAEESDATVQVMTVHKSKGLEFDLVILPELEQPLAGRGTVPAVFARRGTTGPVDRLCRWVRSDLRDALPQLTPLFDEHRERVVRESLCLLYVAMTRAKQALFTIVAPPGRQAHRSLGGVVQQALSTEPPPADALADALPGWPPAGELAYADGELEWLAPARAAGPAAPANGAGAGIELGAAAPSMRSTPRPSAAESTRAIEASLRLPDEAALDRGQAQHALLQLMTWLEDGPPDEARLLRAARGAAPRRDEAWAREQVEAFRATLTRPAVRRVLSRGDRDAAAWELWRERPYARLVGGALERGTFDRVEIERDLLGPRRAVITDFKTDQVTAGEAPVRAEAYRTQIAAYRAAVAELLDLEPAAVAARLLFVEPGVVVECPA